MFRSFIFRKSYIRFSNIGADFYILARGQTKKLDATFHEYYTSFVNWLQINEIKIKIT